jgi:hypothetical protein
MKLSIFEAIICQEFLDAGADPGKRTKREEALLVRLNRFIHHQMCSRCWPEIQQELAHLKAQDRAEGL